MIGAHGISKAAISMNLQPQAISAPSMANTTKRDTTPSASRRVLLLLQFEVLHCKEESVQSMSVVVELLSK